MLDKGLVTVHSGKDHTGGYWEFWLPERSWMSQFLHLSHPELNGWWVLRILATRKTLDEPILAPITPMSSMAGGYWEFWQPERPWMSQFLHQSHP
jgi:hypothetical protein